MSPFVPAPFVPDSPRSWRVRLRSSVVLFLPVLLLLLAAWRPLALPDEGRYAEVGRWMLSSGDWLTPRLDGVPFFHKPPLLYWLEGVSTCYNRVPMPQGYDVIEASIENHPSRGTVTQIDKNVFKYTKNSGHLGMDQYSVRVCAKKRFGTTGCTLIRYNMNSIMGKQGQMERPE